MYLSLLGQVDFDLPFSQVGKWETVRESGVGYHYSLLACRGE